MKLYVGNLQRSVGEDELIMLFRAYGQVLSARVMTDPETRKHRGFAFVDMPNEAEAAAAIKAMNGMELGGRRLKVNEARPLAPREPSVE